MPEFDVERIITRDNSSGMHHLRLVVNGKTFVQEADNLDDAGAYTIVPDLPEDIESVEFCRRCFPELHDPRPANTKEE
jgi:hypothetical protein